MSAFDSLEKYLLDLTLGGQAAGPFVPMAGKTSVALLQQMPAESWDGMPGPYGEPPISASYTRTRATFARAIGAGVPAGDGGGAKNTEALSFTGLPAGTYTHFAVFGEYRPYQAYAIGKDPTVIYPGSTIPGQTLPSQTLPGYGPTPAIVGDQVKYTVVQIHPTNATIPTADTIFGTKVQAARGTPTGVGPDGTARTTRNVDYVNDFGALFYTEAQFNTHVDFGPGMTRVDQGTDLYASSTYTRSVGQLDEDSSGAHGDILCTFTPPFTTDSLAKVILSFDLLCRGSDTIGGSPLTVRNRIEGYLGAGTVFRQRDSLSDVSGSLRMDFMPNDFARSPDGRTTMGAPQVGAHSKNIGLLPTPRQPATQAGTRFNEVGFRAGRVDALYDKIPALPPGTVIPAQTIPAQDVGGPQPPIVIPPLIVPAAGQLPIGYFPLFYGQLTTPVVVTSTSDVVVVPAGGLTLTAD